MWAEPRPPTLCILTAGELQLNAASGKRVKTCDKNLHYYFTVAKLCGVLQCGGPHGPEK